MVDENERSPKEKLVPKRANKEVKQEPKKRST